MGLDEIPRRGESGVYDDNGTTRVPDKIRNSESFKVSKEDNLTWIMMPDEDYVRVYRSEDKPYGEDK